MKPTNHELEAISIRRAKVADAGKVRYRVYSTPVEFVAVIADSALMAVKVSGISKPYKIMRDLITDGPSIAAEHMAPREEREENVEHVAFAVGHIEKPAHYSTELPAQDDDAPRSAFVPLGITDLQRKGNARLSILSPDMVNKIIEDHARQLAEQMEAAPKPESKPMPVVDEAETLPHETVLISPPEPLSTEQKLTQMAQELLPPSTPKPKSVADKTEELSPEEVEKLLNG